MATSNPQQQASVTNSLQVKGWNAVEPGDPYDINKSHIVDLPGKANTLAQNPQLVCLLQAAQIERLNKCLQEYKRKFLTFEKLRMDRHLYETQIKELIEMLKEKDELELVNIQLERDLKEREEQIIQLQHLLRTNQNQIQIQREKLKQRQKKMMSHQSQPNEGSFEVLLKKNNLLEQQVQELRGNEKNLISKIQSLQIQTVKDPEIEEVIDDVKLYSSYNEQITVPKVREEEYVKKLSLQEDEGRLKTSTIMDPEHQTSFVSDVQKKMNDRNYIVDIQLFNSAKLSNTNTYEGGSTEVSTNRRDYREQTLNTEYIIKKAQFLAKELRMINDSKNDISRQLQKKVKESDSLRDSLQKVLVQNEKVQKQIKDLKTELQLIRLHYDEMREENEKNKCNAEQLQKQNAELQEQVEKNINYYEELLRENKNDEQQLMDRMNEMKEAITAYKDRLFELQSDASDRNTNMHRLLSQNESLRRYNAELNRQIQQILQEQEYPSNTKTNTIANTYENANKQDKENSSILSNTKAKTMNMEKDKNTINNNANNDNDNDENSGIKQLNSKLQMERHNFNKLLCEYNNIREENEELNSEIQTKAEYYEQQIQEMTHKYQQELNISSQFIHQYHKQTQVVKEQYECKIDELHKLNNKLKELNIKLLQKRENKSMSIPEDSPQKKREEEVLSIYKKNQKLLQQNTENIKEIGKIKKDKEQVVFKVKEFVHRFSTIVIKHKRNNKDSIKPIYFTLQGQLSNKELQGMLDAVMREIQEIITNKHHEDNKDNPEHEHEHEYDYDYENRQTNNEYQQPQLQHQINLNPQSISKFMIDGQFLEVNSDIIKLRNILLYRQHQVNILQKLKTQLQGECEYYSTYVRYLQSQLSIMNGKVLFCEEQVASIGEQNVQLRKKLQKNQHIYINLLQCQRQLGYHKSQVDRLNHIIHMSSTNNRQQKKRNKQLEEEVRQIQELLQETNSNNNNNSAQQQDIITNNVDALKQQIQKEQQLEQELQLLKIIQEHSKKDHNELCQIIGNLTIKMKNIKGKVREQEYRKLLRQNKKLVKGQKKAKLQYEKTFKKLMLQHYRKMEECKSIKKSICDSDASITKILSDVERLQGIIASLNNQKAMGKAKTQIVQRQNEMLNRKNKKLENENAALKAARRKELEESKEQSQTFKVQLSQSYVKLLQDLQAQMKGLRREVHEKDKVIRELSQQV